MEEFDEAAAAVDERKEQHRHRHGCGGVGGDEEQHHRGDGTCGRPQPHAEPRRKRVGGRTRVARDRPRDVELDPKVGRDRHHPAKRRREGEDPKRLRREPARGDNRDDEHHAFARKIGDGLVADQQRVA